MVVEIVKRELGNEAEVRETQVTKANGIVKTGITIKFAGSNVAPTIYMDEMQGTDEEKAKEIIRIARENQIPNIDIESFTDYSKTKLNIRVKLLDRKANENLPAVKFDTVFPDLIAVPYVEILETGTITVQSEHIKAWGVSEDEVYADALLNMMSETTIASIGSVINEMTGGELTVPEDEAMLVLSNKKKLFGAANILVAKIPEGKIMLPSSIHEVILIDDMGNDDELKEMVKYVNATQVSETDKLSDNVYKYENGKWVIL